MTQKVPWRCNRKIYELSFPYKNLLIPLCLGMMWWAVKVPGTQATSLGLECIDFWKHRTRLTLSWSHLNSGTGVGRAVWKCGGDSTQGEDIWWRGCQDWGKDHGGGLGYVSTNTQWELQRNTDFTGEAVSKENFIFRISKFASDQSTYCCQILLYWVLYGVLINPPSAKMYPEYS